MKKSLVLGAAALAAVVMAAPQGSDAAEVKLGGYYMFRTIDADTTLANQNGADNARFWVHRLQLNPDFVHDQKTHAHARIRIMDSVTVQGSNQTVTPSWDLRAAWLETEMWGVGLKVGNMPISLNDEILVSTNSDDKSFGTLMFAKTFGDHTLVLADVRVNEGNEGNKSGFSVNAPTPALQTTATSTANVDNLTSGAVPVAAGSTFAADLQAAYLADNAVNVANAAADAAFNAAVSYPGADKDDEDLYVISAFGKFNPIDYNLTVAHFRAQNNSVVGQNTIDGDTADNTWYALTLHSDLGAADITGTLIYESGLDNYGSATGLRAMQSGDGFLTALRVKGKAGVGKWNAYGFWATEDFTNIVNNNMKWSKTWDMGGPGASDLLSTWAGGAGGAGASPSENMAGVGAGFKMKMDKWTINPMVDYAAVVEEDYFGTGAADNNTTSAWGGALVVSTEVNKATSLSLSGSFVDPNDENGANNDDLHYLEASVKMKF